MPVHHIRGHIAANYLAYPGAGAAVSVRLSSPAGNTHDRRRARTIRTCTSSARTRDDAAGECFDKAARVLGMPYPGGAAAGPLAQQTAARQIRPAARPRVGGEPLDMSFSGLKTAVVNLVA